MQAYPESGRSSQTQYVFTGETAQLNCSIQPGRARSLYSAVWTRNNVRIDDTTFSLSVPIQNVSQNGTIYQCTVTVQSCSPISRCSTGNRIAVGDFTLHWWEVSASYTVRVSYQTLVYLEHSYKETVILNDYS